MQVARTHLPEYAPGMPVKVRRVRFGGFDFNGEVMAPVEVWTAATFQYWLDGKPVVQWPDGTYEVLQSKAEMR